MAKKMKCGGRVKKMEKGGAVKSAKRSYASKGKRFVTLKEQTHGYLGQQRF